MCVFYAIYFKMIATLHPYASCNAWGQHMSSHGGDLYGTVYGMSLKCFAFGTVLCLNEKADAYIVYIYIYIYTYMMEIKWSQYNQSLNLPIDYLLAYHIHSM